MASEGAIDGRDMGQVVNLTRRGNGGRLHIDGQIKRRKNDPQTSLTLRHPARRIPVILASSFLPRKIDVNTTRIAIYDFEITVSLVARNHFRRILHIFSNKPNSSFEKLDAESFGFNFNIKNRYSSLHEDQLLTGL